MKALINSFLLLCLMIPDSIFGQETNPQLRAVKNSIKMFVANEPEEFSEDWILEGSKFIDTGQMEYSADMILPLMRFERFNNGHREYDGKGYPLSSLELAIEYFTFPLFTRVSVWLEIEGISDNQGNEIMLSSDDYEEYMELGLIEERFSFEVKGESRTTLRFNKDMNVDDQIVVEGKVGVNFPAKVDFILLERDNREQVEINGVSYQILAMEGNMVTMKVTGNRRNMEQNEVHVLNKDSMPFEGYSSFGISEKQYKMFEEYGDAIPDEVVMNYLESVNNGDLMNISEIRKITIEGTADKVFIFHVVESEEIMIPVKIEHTIDFN